MNNLRIKPVIYKSKCKWQLLEDWPNYDPGEDGFSDHVIALYTWKWQAKFAKKHLEKGTK